MLDLSKHTQAIQVRDRETAAAFRLVEDAINRLGRSAGASPVGDVAQPAPIQAVNVKVSGETAHVTITDNSALSRNIHYFLEYANEPNFLAPHVEHLGTSRGRVLSLPANDDTGAPQSYYFRGYSQYPGSKPSPHVLLGPQGSPTAVQMTGTTNMTLLPSTGSGTAAPNGQQGGQGFGTFGKRGPQGPKRSVQI
jgi:hypothetical protein